MREVVPRGVEVDARRQVTAEETRLFNQLYGKPSFLGAYTAPNAPVGWDKVDPAALPEGPPKIRAGDENAAQFMTALGRIDEAFSVLDAYYFAEGFDCGEIRFTASQGTYTPHNDRLTWFLFNPALAPLRADKRFEDLVRRIGLSAYWKESGYPPDYRRA